MAKKKDEIQAEEPENITPPAELELETDDVDEPELGGFHDPIITRAPRKKKDAKEAEPEPEADVPAPEQKKPAFSVVSAPPPADAEPDAQPATPEPAQATQPSAETDIQKQLRDAVALIQQQGQQIAYLNQTVQQARPQQAPEPAQTAEPEPQEPTQEEWDTDALAAMKKHDAAVEHRIWKRFQGHQQEQTQTQRFQTEVQHWDQQAATHIPGYQEISPKADLLIKTAASNPHAGLRGIDKVPAGKFLVSLVEAVFSGKLVPAGQAQQPQPQPQPQQQQQSPGLQQTASGVLEQSRLRRIAAGQSAPPAPNKRPATAEVELSAEQEAWVKSHGLDRAAYARQVGLLNRKRKTA